MTNFYDNEASNKINANAVRDLYLNLIPLEETKEGENDTRDYAIFVGKSCHCPNEVVRLDYEDTKRIAFKMVVHRVSKNTADIMNYVVEARVVAGEIVSLFINPAEVDYFGGVCYVSQRSIDETRLANSFIRRVLRDNRGEAERPEKVKERQLKQVKQTINALRNHVCKLVQESLYPSGEALCVDLTISRFFNDSSAIHTLDVPAFFYPFQFASHKLRRRMMGHTVYIRWIMDEMNLSKESVLVVKKNDDEIVFPSYDSMMTLFSADADFYKQVFEHDMAFKRIIGRFFALKRHLEAEGSQCDYTFGHTVKQSV